MNNLEQKRMSLLAKLANELYSVSHAALDIELGDEKNIEKAKTKIYQIVEDMTDVMSAATL